MVHTLLIALTWPSKLGIGLEPNVDGCLFGIDSTNALKYMQIIYRESFLEFFKLAPSLVLANWVSLDRPLS